MVILLLLENKKKKQKRCYGLPQPIQLQFVCGVKKSGNHLYLFLTFTFILYASTNFMYCWICFPISSNALGLSSASVYLSWMGWPSFYGQHSTHISGNEINCQKKKKIQMEWRPITITIITFNSVSLSMYTCLGWSSPSSYSQFSVSSSFNDKTSRS